MIRAVLVVAISTGCAFDRATPDPAPPIACPYDAATIVVDTYAHRMALCETGVVVREFPVAIGGGGVDKHKQGDRKTPLGTYSLDAPRESSRFHKFLAIGYPTAAQRAEGRTGGDVGIHGPANRLGWRKWFWRDGGPMTDWTDGCIAVGSAEAIEQIATWATSKHANRVVIQ
jgi:murein L,D-transpeptidase YafK